jgi:hypothetical protein
MFGITTYLLNFQQKNRKQKCVSLGEEVIRPAKWPRKVCRIHSNALFKIFFLHSRHVYKTDKTHHIFEV